MNRYAHTPDTLTAEGHEIRNRLAEAGVELTPAQLAAAMADAERALLRAFPTGAAPQLAFAVALHRAIDRGAAS